MKYGIILIVLIGLLSTSCDESKVFEDYSDFDQGFWHQDSLVRFQFEITDAEQPYNLQAQFRNSLSYPFHNMYYKYRLKNERDSTLSERQMEIYFFDPKTGEPNGGGLGDLFDNSQIVLNNYTFSQPGKYSVELQQYMRIDTLPFVLSVGWRVETTSSK